MGKARLLCLLVWMSASSALAQFTPGMPLSEALLKLRQRGLDLVFSTQIVKAEMRVVAVPSSLEPRQILEELLAPHGLAVAEGPGEVLVVISKPAVPSTRQSEILPRWAEEIVVQPSRISLLVDEPAPGVSLNREEIEALPHLGDDVFRTMSVLPGTTTTDGSAQFHIRGSRRDELLILLDGQELYDPYHLQDFDNPLSIIGAPMLARVSLITAAFPVSYGDRMAGVLNMVTVAPTPERKLRISAGLLGAQIDVADMHLNGRLGWIASVRRGSTDLIGRALQLEDPKFWDAFGKLYYEITPRQSVQIHALASRDNLQFEDPEESSLLDTQYHSSYTWLTYRTIFGSDLFVDTTVSRSQTGRDRGGAEDDEERTFEVRDQRNLEVTGLIQSWNRQLGEKNFLKAGVEYQRFEAAYDYFSSREFHHPPVQLETEPLEGVFALDDIFKSEHFSLYVSDRMHALDSLNLEIGLRYDRQTFVDDNLVSPRLSAAWAFRPNNVLRLGWGYFSQSHRAYELMVEDGDTRFYPAERSSHWVVGLEHRFAPDSHIPLTSLRTEVYQRRVSTPRPRYENLFQAFDAYPEGQFDRIRIEPESAVARGIEFLARGRASSKVDWWFNYALASTEDRIDGREVPREVDQTHTFNLDVNYRFAPDWNINVALLSHTGWPITPLEIDPSTGEVIAGERNSERLLDHNRFDMRVTRKWPMTAGTLAAYFDAHNLFARRNVTGVEVLFDETGAATISEEYTPGFYATAGVVWEFR